MSDRGELPQMACQPDSAPGGTERFGPGAGVMLARVRLDRHCQLRETGGVDSTDDVARDRHAIESITGQSFEGMEWPPDAMPPGTRVRVVKDRVWDGPWRNEFTATIDATVVPILLRNASAQPGEREYSVVFDSAQLDVNGDGPIARQ